MLGLMLGLLVRLRCLTYALLVPFHRQNKNIHSLQSQILQNKISESKKLGEWATFLTLISTLTMSRGQCRDGTGA